jgi:Cdc6-like AAA superfamily ATPase
VEEKLVRQYQIQTVFKPSSPIDRANFFAGRRKQLQRLISTIATPGQHAIIFGERGVGKTSLVSVVQDALTHQLRDKGIGFVRLNCDSESDFSSLWNRILHELKINYSVSTGFTGVRDAKISTHTLDTFLRDKTQVYPDDIRIVFKHTNPIVIILDEVDRTQQTTRRLLADTIKALSDYSSNTTLILVGVASDVDGLIDNHHSIERAIVQIRIPRMKPEEIKEILEICLKELDMEMNDDAKNLISLLSRGLPHYAHLIGQYAALEAIKYPRNRITLLDVETAIDLAIGDISHSLKQRYYSAINSNVDSLYADVLLACALADTNDSDDDLGFGYFNAGDVKIHLSELRKKTYEVRSFSKHLADLSTGKASNILERIGEARNYHYRFANPLMQPFIVMKAIQDGKIPYQRLQQILGTSG